MHLSLRRLTFIACGLVALVWLVLSLIALAAGFTGGDPLYVVIPGSTALAQFSLLGKVYLVSSALLPFIVIGALVSA